VRSFVLFVAGTVVLIFSVGLAADSSFANDVNITDSMAAIVCLIGISILFIGLLVFGFYDYYHSSSNEILGSALMVSAAFGWTAAYVLITLNNWIGAILCMILGFGLMLWSGSVMLRNHDNDTI